VLLPVLLVACLAPLPNCGSSTEKEAAADSAAADTHPACICPGGECPTPEAFCSLREGCTSPIGNWAEVGCGKRVVGYYDPMGPSSSYVFDLATGTLVGGCLWSDTPWGPCAPTVITYRWGDARS
jgi:hypothetical protein